MEISKIKIIALNGSLRKKSYTAMALDYVMQGVEQSGASAEFVDLRKLQLGFCDGSGNEEQKHPDVRYLKRKVREAHGIILGTPEYHGSFSGILKNALDLMGFIEFEGKMIGLVGVSAGKMGGFNALNSLRTIGRVLHAWVLPQQVAIPKIQNLFDAHGNLKDQNIMGRLLNLGKDIAKFSHLHEMEKSGKFLQIWESAPDNPGASK